MVMEKKLQTRALTSEDGSVFFGMTDKEEIEALIDEDIAKFDGQMQVSNASPLTRYEKAIIKTYLMARVNVID